MDFIRRKKQRKSSLSFNLRDFLCFENANPTMELLFTNGHLAQKMGQTFSTIIIELHHQRHTTCRRLCVVCPTFMTFHSFSRFGESKLLFACWRLWIRNYFIRQTNAEADGNKWKDGEGEEGTRLVLRRSRLGVAKGSIDGILVSYEASHRILGDRFGQNRQSQSQLRNCLAETRTELGSRICKFKCNCIALILHFKKAELAAAFQF